MPTTSNFGWTTPADTDLVKDGAAAIRTLGNGIDTSFLDLKGGTSGQVLSKASNTDLDFTWVAQDDSNAIQNSIVDAKGDLISATANDTPARLAVGANNTVLTADSSTSTGLKWAAPSSGAMTYITGASFSAVSSFSLPNSTFTATYDNYFLLVNLSDASATTNINIRMRVGGADETGTNYNYRYFITDVGGGTNNDGGTGTASMVFAGTTTTDDRLSYPLYIFSPFLTASTKIVGSFLGSYGGNPGAVIGMGLQHTATSYDSLTFYPSSGTINGSYKLYGIANS